MDLNQAELRIETAISKDPEMSKVYKQDLDIHAYTGAQLYNKSYESFLELKKSNLETYKHYREIGKTLNFGLLYGLGMNDQIIRRKRYFLQFYRLKRSLQMPRSDIKIYQKYEEILEKVNLEIMPEVKLYFEFEELQHWQ